MSPPGPAELSGFPETFRRIRSLPRITAPAAPLLGSDPVQEAPQAVTILRGSGEVNLVLTLLFPERPARVYLQIVDPCMPLELEVTTSSPRTREP